MPLRTRDFLLYLLAFIFLVIAITVTVVEDVYPESDNTASVINTESGSEEVIYTAVVEEEPVLDRAGHLAKLRSKMADFKDTVIGSNPVIEPVETESVEVTEEEPAEVIVAELKCSFYQEFNQPWSPKDLSFSVVEGARLLYREVESTNFASTTSSSTSPAELTKEVLMQLPLQTYGAKEKSCLPSDVVGVALDGSLIKNNEYALYSIFGPETLVGYALDGFPIYGQSEASTDECGGILTGGQYRYYLSDERDAVLYCYSGTPIDI